MYMPFIHRSLQVLDYSAGMISACQIDTKNENNVAKNKSDILTLSGMQLHILFQLE